jgi:diguanylate cyclase (GGDEF)-like protein
LLTDTARLLKSCLREGDFAARIGGDEFAMIVRQGDEGVVESVSRRIGEAVRRYNEKNGAALSLSVGHALLHEGRSRTRDLFKAADADMYRNKLTHKASRNLSPLGGTALGARWG